MRGTSSRPWPEGRSGRGVVLKWSGMSGWDAKCWELPGDGPVWSRRGWLYHLRRYRVVACQSHVRGRFAGVCTTWGFSSGTPSWLARSGLLCVVPLVPRREGVINVRASMYIYTSRACAHTHAKGFGLSWYMWSKPPNHILTRRNGKPGVCFYVVRTWYTWYKSGKCGRVFAVKPGDGA